MQDEPNGGRQVIRAVRQAWDCELTETQKLYMQAYYEDHLTMAKIAERYGVDLTTVSRTLKRARNRLRHILQYYYK